MKTALKHSSIDDYHDLVFLLLDMKDSLQPKRSEMVMLGLTNITDSSSVAPVAAAPAYTGYNYNYNYAKNYVTDKEKLEAILLMAELADTEKDGTSVIDRVFLLRDKWLSSCLVENLEPDARQCALKLLGRCISSAEDDPELKEERLAQCLESLMHLIPTAKRCITSPARVVNVKYHANYDWRLLEYGNAVKSLLVTPAQRQLFGTYITHFAELVQNVDKSNRAGDKSKWALFEALMEGVEDEPSNLEKLLSSKVFVEGLGVWAVGTQYDTDKEVAMFCDLLIRLAKLSPLFLGVFLNGNELYWLLYHIVPLAAQFPESSALVMSLATMSLNSAEISPVFIERLFQSTLSQFEWRDMIVCTNIITHFKVNYSDLLTSVFWSKNMIEQTVKALQDNSDNFLSLCKLLALFIQDCPNMYKPHVLRYTLSSHNCYINMLNSQPVPPTPDELAGLEKDMDTILQVCCGEWQSGAMNLFNALVTDPTCDEPADVSMIVNSASVDRAVRRVFDQGVAELASLTQEDAEHARIILFGMGIAYIVVCARNMPGLSQFVTDLRSHVSFGPTDPPLNFGADRIARAIILTIMTSGFTEEVEKLLADCFSKSAPFAVNEALTNVLAEAMRFIDDAAGLQKVFILSHSPVLAYHLRPFLEDLNYVAAKAGPEADRFITGIHQLLSQPPPEQNVQPMDIEEPAAASASAAEPQTISQDQQPTEPDDQPRGLPPSEEDDDSDAKSVDMV